MVAEVNGILKQKTWISIDRNKISSNKQTIQGPWHLNLSVFHMGRHWNIELDIVYKGTNRLRELITLRHMLQ